MKKKTSICAAVVGVIVCLFAAVAAAFGGFGGQSEVASAASTADFFFENVHIDMRVHEDKTLSITETLTTVWSTWGKSSLIRDVQRQSKTTRLVDGKKIAGKNYFAKISDISATIDGKECDWHIIGKTDEMYLSDFYSIEMKHKDGSLLNVQKPYTFELSYKYDMGDDRVSAFDDLTFDIFGYEMHAAKQFSAKVTFPEGTNLNKDNVSARTSLKLSSVVHPSEDGGEFSVEGNVIQIAIIGLNTGLTLQVILPKGFFQGSVTIYWYYWVFFVLGFVALGGAIILTVKHLPVKPVKTVEFYPPEGVSVMRFSAIWHKTARSKDVAALVLKWADAGLITIEKDGKSDLILRLNNPKEDENSQEVFEELNEQPVEKRDKKYFDSADEKRYFDVLFSNGKAFSTKSFKKASDSRKRALYKANEALVNSANKKKVLQPVSKARKIVAVLGTVPVAGLIVYNCIISGAFLPLFFLIFIIAGTLAGTTFFNTSPSLSSAIILIFPIMFFAMPYGMFVLLMAMEAYDYGYIMYFAPVIWAVCEFLLPFFMGRRTEEANALYGKMEGFKDFLLKAELPRIQLMFDENPDYFSEILPWCLIMGISDKVQKRFAALKSINMPKVLQDDIDVRFVTRCIVYSSVLGAPRSSGGGGGGGGHGGSFGGGGGGGGSRSR